MELSKGDFVGVDGHSGSGLASIVREPNGSRSLTFTGLNVDPGPSIVVWLTQDESNLDDRVDLEA